MYLQMKILILAGVVALCASAMADIPGAFVIQESWMADPTSNKSIVRANYGYAGIAIIGDLDGDGVKDLIAGAPAANDSGALVITKLDKSGKALGTSYILSSSDPLIKPYLNGKEKWGTGIAVAQEFNATSKCAVVVTNSERYPKIWALKICHDGSNVPSISAVTMIDSSNAVFSGLTQSSGLGHSIAILDTTSNNQIVLGIGNPNDGDQAQGKVFIVALDPDKLVFTRLSVIPQSYGASDSVGSKLTSGESFGTSLAPLRGVNGIAIKLRHFRH